ncbi:MAG: hypothetical protein CL610_01145 [Anaerolineaceae bacterium]|nr:hypothetical protein [Anaerolineaceae bacterium]
MTTYGIKLVWAGWENDPTIGFSNRASKRWADELPAGTRMLLYETTGKPKGSKAKGTKSLVGEVEVTGTFDDGAKIRAADEQHDAVIPVRVVQKRESVTPVPLDTVREVLKDEQWPRMGESWRPLSDAEYQALVKLMG